MGKGLYPGKDFIQERADRGFSKMCLMGQKWWNLFFPTRN